MHLFFDPAAWASLVTLTALEIVLGVDNIVVLSILTSGLPAQQARSARRAGLALALILRLALLSIISTVVRLTAPVFAIGAFSFSWRDLILMAGGLFLIFKATQEIHAEIEGRDGTLPGGRSKRSFGAAIAQIAVMDLIFSLDSIVTAVGLAQDIEVMAAAIFIAVAIMYFAANVTADFIERHPTLKMLALAFLILIGAVLTADGFGAHVPRAAIYVAIGFAGLVEALNIWARGANDGSGGKSARAVRSASKGTEAQQPAIAAAQGNPSRRRPPPGNKKPSRKKGRRK